MPLTKNGNPTFPSSPSGAKALLLAARPRTWIAGIAPVALGGALAFSEGSFQSSLWTLTLLFALLIQIGTNYANDAFDFLKGADTQERLGPPRATQQGWLSPRSVFLAAGVSLGTALLIAAFLIVRLEILWQGWWWSVPLALLSALCAILYTGGPKPLGYLGLGELFVFVFFGPVALLGTYFLQTGALSQEALFLSFSPGLFGAALLAANNLRDETTDTLAGKKTLIVRWGKTFGAWEYRSCLLFALLFGPTLGWLLLPLAWKLSKLPFSFSHPKELLPLLEKTAQLFIAHTLLSCAYLFI